MNYPQCTPDTTWYVAKEDEATSSVIFVRTTLAQQRAVMLQLLKYTIEGTRTTPLTIGDTNPDLPGLFVDRIDVLSPTAFDKYVKTIYIPPHPALSKE